MHTNSTTFFLAAVALPLNFVAGGEEIAPAVPQQAANGDVLRVYARGTAPPTVIAAIMRKGPRVDPVNGVQNIQILSRDGTKVEVRIRFSGNYAGACSGGWCSYAKEYELVRPSDFPKLGSATFDHEGRKYTFDLTGPEGHR
jgi:hypothetical protein